MRVELSTLHAQLGSTMIYVTHDQVEAMTMATRIVVLNKGEIEQVGSPLELYTNPKNLFVAGFLGAPRMNFFEGTVADISGNTVITAIEGFPPVSVDNVDAQALSTGDRITLGVRPEKLVTNGGSSVAIPARVRLVEHLGRETVFYADASPLKTSGSDTGTENVTVQMPQIVPLSNDAAVTIGFEIADVYLFGPDGRTLTAH
ncbi:TOBE domain-containing protein [Rhizobium bangladeshense]|uniref:TOBE domain-containing protein n=1 Tax=Rhizobium bangladeshense TaxID=1138189 RepID=A0ABS7LRA4_9HYPH|nr:TOBE domain-containing protein [Rhizobium bangladeshense]MBX4876590.1 TOBE domain-containing protein [Rhizobium bangladeshense]MBX4887430.1 TOBE domain-containing protein [Rhizobium bangladeshense]MBY3593913.1 TOBE domain-containing protein [Rhizobium bangladeshense]MBY3599796.1 TOBE domain-containing protein [Rhizobium bangladeshense]